MAGEWKQWVDYNNKLDQQEKKDNGVRYVGTRHPDWPVDEKKIFPAKPIKKMADKIIDKNYQQNKNKSPFTQVAENAVKELSFKMKDGFIENNAGNHRLDNVKEAIELNEALDKNFRDHKEDDYLKLIESNRLAEKESPKQTWNRLDANEKKRVQKLRQQDDLDKMVHFGIENSSVKHPDYPRAAPKARLANMPILNRNINNYKKSKTPPTKTNATVERYKQFKEDKKFNDDFNKEYSDQAIKNHIRAKVNKNKREGKRDYDNLSINDIIVNEHAKDAAKEQLAKIKIEPVKLNPTYIDYRLALKDVGPTITLEEHLAKTAPREADPLGITALKGAKNFKRTFDTANKKFNLNSPNGVSGLLGEYDAN